MPIPNVERRTQNMGMSASQARLLSITARLTNNEFRSQTITNSKLRLATESEEASQAYMDALNQKQLQFMYYDNNGNAQKVPLTGAFLSTYAPMKNQYSILNAAGKILVSHTDAVNFENTETLDEFLACYGLVDDVSAQAAYHAQYEQYLQDMENYRLQMEQYNIILGRRNLYKIFSDAVGTSDRESANPPKDCYDAALYSGGSSCYLHVLNHLLDWNGEATEGEGLRFYREWTDQNGGSDGYYTTSADTGFIPNVTSMGGMSANTPDKGLLSEFAEISAALDETYELDGVTYPLYVCDGIETPGLEAIKEIILNGTAVTPPGETNGAERLKALFLLCSDYTYDENLNPTGIKSLKQKVIDMYYFIQNWQNDNINAYFKHVLKANGYDNGTDDELVNEFMRNLLVNFTEGDMRKLAPDLPAKPIEPTMPLYSVIVNDREKAQWYTNLWFKMNGSESANLVKQIEGEDSGKIEFSIENLFERIKDGHKVNYEEYEGNLYTNSEWLEFALEHGLVSMEQARYYNPADDSGKILNSSRAGIYWQGIIHTEAADIISVDDEKAIAIAEAKYKRRVTEIQNKDKKYDQDLKKLDTEHNALQTEYESIKEVISKNTERSFKAFS